jgi:lactate dehydrogenase-like 2-hydroxyacid dehydrogenase
MKLLITRTLPDRVIAAARAEFDVTLRDDQTPLTVTGAKAQMQMYDAILPTLGDQFQAPAFAEGVRCQMLANFGVGYNHIDVAAAVAAGVAVSNTPGAVTDATADIAMTLMLMVCRRAGEGERLVRSGNWHGWEPTQMLGLHMSGKTLGIIGMGRIGQAIAQRAHFGFGMRIVFHNRSPKVPTYPARQLDSVEAVMNTADVVVIAVPATPETHHMINADALTALGSKSFLVNIARGDIIDEAALIDALQTGRIAGAGLDVYEFEPKVPAALTTMDNVVLLPHLGTAALEVREAMGLMAVDNLIAFKRGEVLPNAV